MSHRESVGRRVMLFGVAVACAAVSIHAVHAEPSPTTLTEQQPAVTWQHEPITAGADSITLTVELPADYWQQRPGGVTIRATWGNTNSEFGLRVSDRDGRTIAAEDYGGRDHAQVYVPSPPNGDYTVTVQAGGSVPGVGPAYSGAATIVDSDITPASVSRGGMSFARSLVDSQVLGNEPGLALDPDGRVFVDVPGGVDFATSYIWRSEDGAQTFHAIGTQVAPGIEDPRRRACATSGGGGDIDVVADRTGRVYFADLEGFQIAIGYSTDHGETWTCGPLGASTYEDDRPWLAAAPTADGAGPNIDAYLCYIDLIAGQLPGGGEAKPQQVHVDVTRDGGQTWAAFGSFGAGTVPIPGPMFVDRSGTVYEVFSALEAVWLAKRSHGESDFAITKVSQRPADPRGNGSGWVTGAVDDAGNVYAAWIDGGTGNVLFTRSTDGGDHWTAPQQVSPPGQVAIRPWLAAGRRGDVAIAWYGANGDFLPGPGAPAGTRWYPFVARTLDAVGKSPRFALARMSDVPSLIGFGDSVDAGSVVADFFKIAIGADGQLYAAYCDAGRSEQPEPYEVADTAYETLNKPPQPQPYVVVARQTAGIGMPHAARHSRGHGHWQGHDAVGHTSDRATQPATASYVGPAPLHFTSPPTVRSATAADGAGQLETTFSLGGANLDNALGGRSLPDADAYWIVVWRTSERLEYVGMHRSRSGTSYFGGVQPQAGIHPTTEECCATYPSALTFSGNVDSSGTVTIVAPLSALHLSPGDTLSDVQAFSLVGTTTAPTKYTLLDEADATPAVTHTLS